MVSFLISIPIIALALWLVPGTTRRMWQLKAGWRWWTALGVIVLCGGYAGFRLGHCEIQISPTLRWGGLPLPIGFFALEDDRWTDFIPPPPVQCTNFLADILTPVLLLAIPLAIVWRRRARAASTEAGANPQGERTGGTC
jgi:hypothetical protein